MVCRRRPSFHASEVRFVVVVLVAYRIRVVLLCPRCRRLARPRSRSTRLVQRCPCRHRRPHAGHLSRRSSAGPCSGMSPPGSQLHGWPLSPRQGKHSRPHRVTPVDFNRPVNVVVESTTRSMGRRPLQGGGGGRSESCQRESGVRTFCRWEYWPTPYYSVQYIQL